MESIYHVANICFERIFYHFRALGEENEAVAFSEASLFVMPPETDLTGYQAAVGVLSALLGLIIIGAIAGYVYYDRKRKRSPKGFVIVNIVLGQITYFLLFSINFTL